MFATSAHFGLFCPTLTLFEFLTEKTQRLLDTEFKDIDKKKLWEYISAMFQDKLNRFLDNIDCF